MSEPVSVLAPAWQLLTIVIYATFGRKQFMEIFLYNHGMEQHRKSYFVYRDV